MTQRISPSRFFTVVLGIFALCALLYAGAWFALARQINAEIDALWQQAAASGVILSGDKPKVAGFPKEYRLKFSGKIEDARGMVWDMPEAFCEGFPFPGRPLLFSFPRGFTVSGPLIKEPVMLEHAIVEIGIPKHLPKSWNENGMKEWQSTGETMPVYRILARNAETALSGSGQIGLDENLQLSGNLSLKIAGLDSLLVSLSEKGRIDPNRARVMMSLLQALGQKDETMNVTYFPAEITFQREGFFLGPVRVVSLPHLTWTDAGLQLAPPQ